MIRLPGRRQRELLGLLLVLLVALSLRWGHLGGLQSALEGSHLFSMPRGDAVHHWAEAEAILDDDFWLADRVPWKGPGYSYFLALLMTLFGRSADAIRWVLALLGALNCVGLVLLARRLLSPGWSLLAGLLAAINGVLILFDGELLFPTLLISLNLGALLLLTRSHVGPGSRAAAGALLGLASLVHPVYLLPLATLAMWIAVRHGRRGAAFLLAAAVVIAPAPLLNRIVRDQPILISWNGGINLYVGNQPAFDQYSGNRTNAWVRILESPIDAGITSESERDRLYHRLAGEQVLRTPGRALLTLLHKSWLLLSPVEYANNIRIYELRSHSPVLAATLGRWGPLWWPFGLWGPLMGIGAWCALRRERSPLVVALLLWSLGLAASIVVSFNTSRYRAPLVFFGCIGLAYALAAGRRAWLEGRRRRLLCGVAVFAVLVLLLAATAVPQRGFPLPMEWDEAMALSAEGNYDRAEPWVLRALERAPDDAPLRYAAASFYARQERREPEREQLKRMLSMPQLEPDLIVIGHKMLARSLAEERRFDEATREIEAAIAVNVDETDWRGLPYYRLGLGPITTCHLRLDAAEIDYRAGRTERAEERIDRVRRDCPQQGRFVQRMDELEVLAVLATGGER